MGLLVENDRSRKASVRKCKPATSNQIPLFNKQPAFGFCNKTRAVTRHAARRWQLLKATTPDYHTEPFRLPKFPSRQSGQCSTKFLRFSTDLVRHYSQQHSDPVEDFDQAHRQTYQLSDSKLTSSPTFLV